MQKEVISVESNLDGRNHFELKQEEYQWKKGF